MKLAYTSIYSAQDIHQWSGTPYYMTQALEHQGIQLEYIGPLTKYLPPFFKIKQFWKKISFGQRESARFNIEAAKNYSHQVAQKLLTLNVHAVIAPQINPIAYLECKQPIIIWTDALYAGLVGFHQPSSTLSPASVQQGNQVTHDCLSRCQLAIFSSDWAARSAIELYGTNRKKVKVVPFGANLEHQNNLTKVQDILKNRSRDKIRLLFMGTQWELKGGNIVFQVANTLHATGHAVELHFVGCYPPKNVSIPSYIKCYGFISKRTPDGTAKIAQLLRESHFLFVPSRSEAYGIVFCEANAFGVPCLTSHVGGISTIVKDNINGFTFASDTTVEDYCSTIVNSIQHYQQYEELALSSFHEYESRLNWKVATQKVRQFIQEIL